MNVDAHNDLGGQRAARGRAGLIHVQTASGQNTCQLSGSLLYSMTTRHRSWRPKMINLVACVVYGATWTALDQCCRIRGEQPPQVAPDAPV
jgi:hypothetical protein